MSANVGRAERLVNLVIALLSTRQYVPVSTIRKTVIGYQDSPSDEAFGRMFERDKTALRDLGIPLEFGQVSDLADVHGYRISRSAYELPDIDFTADERAAIAVARRLWQSPQFAAATAGALGKLRSAGVDVDADDRSTEFGAAPLGESDGAVLAELFAAIDAGRAVKFTHRPPGRAEGTERSVEPWAVVTHRGRWYLVGHDRDRDAVRTFRVSRIVGKVTAFGGRGVVTVPADLDPLAVVAAATESVREAMTVRVWVAEGKVHELRRAGAELAPRTLGGRAGHELEITTGSFDEAVRSVAGYAPDAIALEPPKLRDEVIAHLRAVAGGAAYDPEPAADVSAAPEEDR